MKWLYVVRHAKSSWSNPDLRDSERPLNKRGHRNAPEMGQRLRKKEVSPDLLISSKANRSITTARYIAREINYPVESILIEEALYHRGVREMIGFIQSLEDDITSVMIFGHNPGFTSLVNYLTGSDIYNIPTAGIATCSFELENWADIDYRTGVLKDYDYPKRVMN